jgi:SAM-dependent methyltransferase
MNAFGYVRAYVRFLNDFRLFRRLARDQGSMAIRWKDRHVCLNEKTAESGFDRHYVYHTAWAARVVAQIRPEFHIDISSSLYFCSIVSAFVPVRFFEFRPPALTLDNLTVDSADLSNLPFETGSVSSVSCMHVIEHAGLGRYGDPLDPGGDLRAVNELKRVCGAGGSVIFVVPVGKPRIAFNAHRVYSPHVICEYFAPLSLREFSFIPEKFSGGPPSVVPEKDVATHRGEGCGCFWFVK